MEKLQEFVDQNYKLIIFLLLGLILIGFGAFSFKNGGFTKSDSVEVLNSSTESNSDTSEIVVEISGAVENPGVYKFQNGARVDDLLISAGGISVDADRNWIEKTINRAAKLIDGNKYYIPKENEQPDVLSANDMGGIKLDQDTSGSRSNGLININTSDLSTLDTLPGIGPVYGQSIIEHRPYSTVEELLSKGALKSSTYEKIKDLVSVY